MKGWKTKVGTILAALGGILEGAPGLFPYQELVGKILLAVGASLATWGIAHKIEKAKE